MRSPNDRVQIHSIPNGLPMEPLTRLYFDEFQICPACKQLYWKGSHYERMARLIEQNTENDHLPDS